MASGGLSYMPPVTIDVSVNSALDIGDIPGLPPTPLPDFGVSASARLEGGLGGNLGAGVRVPVGSSITLVFEARAFGFPSQQILWHAGSGDPSPIEEILASALDPIELDAGYFQATAGAVFSF